MACAISYDTKSSSFISRSFLCSEKFHHHFLFCFVEAFAAVWMARYVGVYTRPKCHGLFAALAAFTFGCVHWFI